MKERRRDSLNPFQTDKPIAAINRRAKYGIAASKRCKGTGDTCRGDPRNIRTNDADGTGWHTAQQPPHPVAQIARPLRHAGQMIWPDAAFEARMVRSHRKNHLPTGIVKLPQKARNLMPEPPRRRDHADVTTQTGFNPSGARFLDHDDQIAAHYSK